MIFDIEADGMLESVSQIHSLVIKQGEEVISCANQPGYVPIDRGVDLLREADVLVAQNGISYDLPVLKKVLGVDLHGKIFDTLNVSRLEYTNLFEMDAQHKKLPKNLYGSHSLKAWGYRLNILKDTFAEETDWKEWSKEMQEYCEQDVKVTEALYKKLKSRNLSDRAVKLEIEFQKIITKQEQDGVPFDTIRARQYAETVRDKIDEKRKEIQNSIPFHIKRGGVTTPKVSNRKLGRKKGCSYCKLSINHFNPGSRLQVIEYFQRKYGWKPTVFTDKGNPRVDDEVLRALGYPEAKEIADYLNMIKIQGYLETGKNAWIKLVKNGRIHGRVITNGAVTGRCTHSSPNLAQVPSARSFMGPECRSLFHAGSGYMVGADASGLELRCLAHYLHRYDGGEYGRQILEGDIHSVNQRAAGLETRDQAKTFIYSFIYGAGIEKLGSVVTNKQCNENGRIGRELKERFLAKVPALAQLIQDVRWRVRTRDYLTGLDGRKLHIRSDHLALNTLLQSAGAILMKQATVNFWKDYGASDIYQALHVHDEFSIITPTEARAEEVGSQMVDSMTKAGEDFKFNIRIDGEYKVGKNWNDVH